MQLQPKAINFIPRVNRLNNKISKLSHLYTSLDNSFTIVRSTASGHFILTIANILLMTYVDLDLGSCSERTTTKL